MAEFPLLLGICVLHFRLPLLRIAEAGSTLHDTTMRISENNKTVIQVSNLVHWFFTGLRSQVVSFGSFIHYSFILWKCSRPLLELIDTPHTT